MKSTYLILLRCVGAVGSPSVPKRTFPHLGRVVVGLGVALSVLVGVAGPASAHNSFVSSDPADGATLENVPAKLALTFGSDVVLAQLTVDFADAAGSRSGLTGFASGSSSAKTVLVPVPASATGAVSFRWKLVGSDGHTLTGRIGLTMMPTPAVVTTAAPPVTPTAAAPAIASEGLPAASTVATETTDVPVADLSSTTAVAEASSSTGSRILISWFLRLAAFVGLVVVSGAALTSALLWDAAWDLYLVRQAAAVGVGFIGVSTAVLLAMFYSEVNSLSVVLGTSYGLALAARLLVVPALALMLFRWYPHDVGARWLGVGAGLVAAALTWSWSGHPRSLQSLRIDGGPIALFTTTHGRLLILKILVLALMLYVANVNRTRVVTRFRAKQPSRGIRVMLQRAMVTEAAVGLTILAVTAVLVVNSPPPG